MEPLAPEDVVEEWSDLSTSSLGPGSRLGRYELILPIAYGGMARVWSARLLGQRGFSKLVAIKTILPHLAHSAEFEKMFLDEARIAARVHHPNVTEIYELGEEGHVLYLVMEWVSGESLVHVVRGRQGKDIRPVEPRLAARIVADACAGLHAAHELVDDSGRPLGVVHRDISPHNILLSLEGAVKVTDFGVAKALGQSHDTTMAGQIKGKVSYMAPEIIASSAFDRRSDIFGMGCVLYETVTGRPPFVGGNDPQVMQAVVKGAFAPPESVVPGFPLPLTAIISRALASDQQRRFATAEQMRVALEEWLARSGPLVTPSQVGAVVRERLGAHLDTQRERVRTAMAAAQERETRTGGGVRPAAGTTMNPSDPPLLPNPLNQSHSGIIATYPGTGLLSDAAPTIPLPMPTPTPMPPMSAPYGQSMADQSAPFVYPVPDQSLQAPAQPAASGARYAVAAAAGVVFALLVGWAALTVWGRRDLRAVEPSEPATPAATVAPNSGPTTTAKALGADAPPMARAAASSDPATVNVNDLPTAKPALGDTPPPVNRWLPVPPAPSKAVALPANPY